MAYNVLRISVVSYLNSTPFVEGLQNSSYKNNYELSLDIPSICAAKLLNDDVDIGLIPVAMIPKLNESHIISDYCIGADGKVASVLIVANEPIEQLTSVIQDRESRTSVMLAKILFRNHWKLSTQWKEEDNTDIKNLPANTGAVIIGNRALEYKSRYKNVYDLAEEWKKYSGLPFVFACWVSNKKISAEFENELNMLFKEGLLKRDQIAERLKSAFPLVNIREYLFENIKFELSAEAKKGMQLFLELLKTLTE